VPKEKRHMTDATKTTTGLHVFVNRRKFDAGDGVQEEMTGGQLADLVQVPRDNAVVRRESGPEKQEPIGIDQVIQVNNGEHFLVTRRVVEGGHVAGAY